MSGNATHDETHFMAHLEWYLAVFYALTYLLRMFGNGFDPVIV